MKSSLTVKGSRSLGLAFCTNIAESKLRIAVVLCFVTNEAEDSSHNVPHHHLPRLRGHQALPDALNPLNELG